MGEKRILVFENGAVSKKSQGVSSMETVTWLPDDSDRTVKITFLGSVPFDDWDTCTKSGATVSGRITIHVGGKVKYKYRVSTARGHGAATRSDPDLIVDGGGGSGGGKKKSGAKAKKGKKAAKKKR